ncbi:hypothetical protein ACRDU6_09005 [Mycolicibacterium sp. ELW1]|uniref:hypothetical protein n=1 Tax=Mycobacteriaceae TaxID=1762 RepID=UPI0011EC85E5|nr:hypothetical protein [Mycobacterium sp. ELW1]QEN12809.1 hypothetical protein D3H54_05545 [Mycobacterium sp. ELW1]
MSDGDLLELRVHGVNNTPPVSMLYAIQQEYGDSLVGVYRERPTPGVVKALSWGGLARLSPSLHIPFARWVRAVASAAWIFVIPFGLANVAYWSRKLTMPDDDKPANVRFTAALSRAFSLGLTLLLVSSVCSVSLDMAESRIATLMNLDHPPTWVALFKHHTDEGDRLAILSLAPALVILLLWSLATVTRVRYDKGVKLPPPADDRASHWKFGTPSFWDNADLSAHNAGIHTAAGLALSLMWTGQFWLGEHRILGILVIALSGLILAGSVALAMTAPLATQVNAIGALRKSARRLLTGVAVATFLVQFVALICWHSPTAEPARLVMFSLAPGIISFLLLVIAVSALGWRQAHRWAAHVVGAGLSVLGAAALLTVLYGQAAHVDTTRAEQSLIGALVVVAVAWVCWLRWHERAQEAQAWHGSAPGILMILALFSGVLLSTVFVAAAAALLNDGKISLSDSGIRTPPALYLSFAATLGPAIVAMILLVVLVVVTVISRCPEPVEPDLDRTTQPGEREMACLAEISDSARRQAGCCGKTRCIRRDCLYCRRRSTRKVASMLHRAEPVAAWLAVIAALATASGLATAVLQYHDGPYRDGSVLDFLQKTGVIVAVLSGAVIVGHGVSKGRPLGIVWDLICFLPRAAHPFGPPCYAQRAIPELHTYCRAWLDSPPTGESGSQSRRLILSAHSLGGVLAVAVILLLSDMYRDRIALLTYGCQLRAYFSRLFPELLGPRVLGVPASSPARLLRCPTFRALPQPEPNNNALPPSVLATLTNVNGERRWINLWRPTDYLGFPVYSREPKNPVDRPADEVTAEHAADGEIVLQDSETDVGASATIDLTTRLTFKPAIIVRVDTHSDYFRAGQYPAAAHHLALRLSTATAQQ